MAGLSVPVNRLLWLPIALGVMLLVIAAVVWQVRMRFEAQALRADGTVVARVHSAHTASDGTPSRTWCPDVRFTTRAGRSVVFTGSVCAKPASYRVGERVAVLYPREDPMRASVSGFGERWLAVLITGCVGLVFLLVGLLLVLPGIVSRRRGAELQRSGRPVMATVAEVIRDPSMQVNGRSPWRICAQWLDPADRILHVFQSDTLWFDPSPFLQPEMRVLIDPHRPARYWVDTRGLPQMASR